MEYQECKQDWKGMKLTSFVYAFYKLNLWTALAYIVPSMMQGQQIHMKDRTFRSW